METSVNIVELAHKERLHGDIFKAIDIFNDLHVKEPLKWLYELGISYRRAGFPKIGKEYIRKHELLHGVSPQSRIEVSLCLQSTGDYDGAKKLLLESLFYFGGSDIEKLLVAIDKLAFLKLNHDDIVRILSVVRKYPSEKTNDIFLSIEKKYNQFCSENFYFFSDSVKGLINTDFKYSDIIKCINNKKYDDFDFFNNLIKAGAFSFLDGVIDSRECKIFGEDKHIDMFTFWDKPCPPDEIINNVRSWEEISSAEIKCYSDDDARLYISNNMSNRALEAYDKCHHPAMKSDFFRMCRLFNEGGFYIDADEFLINDILFLPKLLKVMNVDRLFVIDVMSPRVYAHNYAIFCRKGDELIGMALDQSLDKIINNDLEDIKNSIWPVTGPGNLTKAISRGFKINNSFLYKTAFISSIAFRNFFVNLDLNYKKVKELNWRNV